jgi:hypothetical protein
MLSFFSGVRLYNADSLLDSSNKLSCFSRGESLFFDLAVLWHMSGTAEIVLHYKGDGGTRTLSPHTITAFDPYDVECVEILSPPGMPRDCVVALAFICDPPPDVDVAAASIASRTYFEEASLTSTHKAGVGGYIKGKSERQPVREELGLEMKVEVVDAGGAVDEKAASSGNLLSDFACDSGKTLGSIMGLGGRSTGVGVGVSSSIASPRNSLIFHEITCHRVLIRTKSEFGKGLCSLVLKSLVSFSTASHQILWTNDEQLITSGLAVVPGLQIAPIYTFMAREKFEALSTIPVQQVKDLALFTIVFYLSGVGADLKVMLFKGFTFYDLFLKIEAFFAMEPAKVYGLTTSRATEVAHFGTGRILAQVWLGVFGFAKPGHVDLQRVVSKSSHFWCAQAKKKKVYSGTMKYCKEWMFNTQCVHDVCVQPTPGKAITLLPPKHFCPFPAWMTSVDSLGTSENLYKAYAPTVAELESSPDTHAVAIWSRQWNVSLQTGVFELVKHLISVGGAYYTSYVCYTV